MISFFLIILLLDAAVDDDANKVISNQFIHGFVIVNSSDNYISRILVWEPNNQSMNCDLYYHCQL